MLSYPSVKSSFEATSLGLISTLLLLTLLTYITSCTGTIAETSSLVKANSTTHYIPIEKLGDASRYWNISWQGHSPELYNEIQVLTIKYCKTHQYVFGKEDCNDMAVDIWQELLSKEIVSLIVVGNLEKSHESFIECNHAWLIIYNGSGSAVAIDMVRGKVYAWEDVHTNPLLRQYWEGFVYESPSDLRKDFKVRW